MEKSEFIRIRVTREEKALLELKAARANSSLSEYLRGLIQASATEALPTEELIKVHFELSIQTGLMVNKIMERLLGEDEDARDIRDQVRSRAEELVEKTLERIKTKN